MRTLPSLWFVLCVGVAAAGCGGGGGTVQPPAPGNLFPPVTASTGNTASSDLGVLAEAALAGDAGTGAFAKVAAGTTVRLEDPAFDSDGDGLADTFTVTILPVGAFAAKVSVGSMDFGETGRQLRLLGGAAFLPVDARFDQPAELLIPLAAGADTGTAAVLDVWRLVEARAASRLSGLYWLYSGRGGIEQQGSHRVVRFLAERFSIYAVSLPVAGNHPPTISFITANPRNTAVGVPISLECLASDPDGDVLSFEWSGGGTFATASAATTQWSAPSPASYMLECTVSDGKGYQDSGQINVVVSPGPPNQPPVIVSITANPTSVLPAETVDLSCYATDPDDASLVYQWSGGGVFADAGQAITTWSSDTPGDYDLVCAVQDPHGNQASQSTPVQVKPPPDTQPPQWTGGQAGLSAAPRESYVYVLFNDATDATPPVNYTLYYDESANYSPGSGFGASATVQHLTAPPSQPLKIEPLTMGTAYTFGVEAEDSAPTPNVTTLAVTEATPQPYYDSAPLSDREFGADVKFADVAAIAQTESALCVVWADPVSGALQQSYCTDGAWVERNVSTTPAYVLPQVFFLANRPVIIGADGSGGLDSLVQELDGTWTVSHLFTRNGVQHVALDVMFDPATHTAYIAHVTESSGPPLSQALHFMAVSFAGGVPTILDEHQDIDSAPYIGQVRVAPDAANKPTIVYSKGTASYVDPHQYAMQLAFATYDPLLAVLSTPVVAPGFNPVYFDVRANGSGWDAVLTDAVAFTVGGYDLHTAVLRRTAGSGTTWSAPEDLFPGTATLNPGPPQTIDYEVPMECVLAPSDTSVYYTRGTGQYDTQLRLSTATLQLYHYVAPASDLPEPGDSLARLTPYATSSARFLLGMKVTQFDFQSIANQLDFPGGYLVLRVLP